MRRRVRITLTALGTLLLALLLAVHVILSPKVVGRIVTGLAEDYVDGRTSIGRIKVSVIRSFPKVRVDIDDIAITYPHELFAQYDSSSVESHLLAAGRGSSEDTLAAFHRFSGAVDVIALLRGRIRVPQAELNGLRLYGHSYDSTAANWNIIRISESDDSTSTSIPDLALGRITVDGRPHIIYTAQADTIFAELSFDALQFKGSLQNIDKRRAKDRIGLNIDSLRIAGRLPADTLALAVNHFEIFEHKDHVDLEAEALAQLYTWTFGRLDLPIDLDIEVGFKRPGDGSTLIDLQEFKAQIAELPLEASGSAIIAQDSSFVDARAAIEGYKVGGLIDHYLSRAIPSLDAFSTDAIITLEAQAKGWFKEGRLPAVRASLEVPDSHFAYEGLFEGGNFDLELIAECDEKGRIDADLKDFCFKIPGADLNIVGNAQNVLGGDPYVEVQANACTEFAELVKYLPEDSGIHAAGDVDFDISGKFRLSELQVGRLPEARIDGRIFSDGLRLSMPADSIFALMSHPDIHISTTRRKGSVDLSGAIDSLRMNVGSGTYIMGSGFSLTAQSSGSIVDEGMKVKPIEALLKASSLNMRGTDSLSIGLRNSANRLVMSRTGEGQNSYKLSLDSENEMLFFRSGGNRLALQNADFTANAEQRTRGNARRPRAASDSLRSRRQVPGDSAAVWMSRSIPELISDLDFSKKDIDIQLGESLVELFRKWAPSGSLSIGYGTITTPMLPLRNSISEVKGTFNDNEISVKSLNLKSGTSSMSGNGTLRGIRGLLTGQERTRYRASLNLRSRFLNLNEIIAALDAGAKMSSEDMEALSDEQIIIEGLEDAEVEVDGQSLIVIPANVNANVSIGVDSIRYAAMGLNDFKARIQMQDRCLQLTEASARADFSDIALDAFYSTKSKEDISSGFNLSFGGITSEKVIDLFPTVDSLVPMLKSFKGSLDCEMAATSQLDTNMNLLIPSINGVVKINGSGLELEDTGSLRRLAKILMFKDTRVGHIDDMSINGIIANNQLEIFPFILGVDRYTLALKGLQNFNQNFNQNFKYHISVIDSPLPFKFGVNLWGNFDDWKYNIGKAQYRNTRIPMFTSEIDTMQVNLVASIKDIFRKGVDVALRENQDARRNVDRLKDEFGYIIDDEDDMLSVEEQEQLDLYLLDQECEAASKKIEEEIEAMMKKEMEELMKQLNSGL